MPRLRRGLRCGPSSALTADVAAAVTAAASRSGARKARKAKKVLITNKHKRRRRAKGPVTKRTSVAARLLAGVRCHNRFYGALVLSFENAYGVNHCQDRDGPATTLVAEACGAVPIRNMSATIMFEVDMGDRRPDCICILDRVVAAGAPRESVCLIVELKTCRFSRAMLTNSKKNQYATGLRQLRDSAKLICDLAVPGADFVRIVPVLVFVAQRGMRIIDVKKFNERVVYANAELLRVRLTALSAYSRGFAAMSRRRQSDQGESANSELTAPSPLQPMLTVVPAQQRVPPDPPPTPPPRRWTRVSSPPSQVELGSALAMTTAVLLGGYARNNKSPR